MLKGSTAILLLAAATSGAAAQEFEGVAKYRMTMQGGRTTEMTFYQKGSLSRQEMGEGPRATVQIHDAAAGTSLMLMPAQKMYMTMDAGMLGGMARSQAPANAKMPKITRTGQTETIAGIRCEHVIMEPQDNPEKLTVDYCVAKGMGVWRMMGGAGAPGGRGGPDMSALPGTASDPAARELMKEFKDGFFPLKMTMKKGDQPGMSMEALSIEKKSLSADTFKPPADYTEFKMPGRGR